MKKVLIVEDELHLAEVIQLELEHEGYVCSLADTGRIALQKALDEDFDVVLLDLMLPEMNGIEVCRKLRLEKQTPIIMLTARDSTMDKVNGLQAGADDYVVKPFAMEELLARIGVVLRRQDYAMSTNVVYKDLRLDVQSHKVIKNDEEILLTSTEFQLLYMFMTHIGEALHRDDIMNEVWGFSTGVETNVVDVYVRYLRNKIELDQKYIHTIRGVGYRFE